MTDSVRFIGPRGWAALVLASGAALSAPFLRNPPPSPGNPQAGARPQLDVSQHSWPELREHSLTPSTVATNLSEQDWAELTRLQKPSGASPRKVSGELPSTNGPPKLPAWADHGPQVDQLVKENLRHDALPPLASDHEAAALAPLRPWMGHGLKPNPDADPNSATASLPTPTDSPFALNQPDPDARWSNTQPVIPTDNSGATPSHSSLVRKFENHIKQWPDESVAPPQFFQDARNAALATRDATRPDVNWPSNAGTTTPLDTITNGISSPGQMASTSSPQQPPATISSPFTTGPFTNTSALPTPTTLSAPMVSSQSGRPVRRPTDPTIIDPTKPSPNTPRPKHFIQQPPKRA